MPVPLVVLPTIFNAFVVSPMIPATAAGYIVVVVAIQVMMIVSLVHGVEGDGDGGLPVS